MAFDIKRIYYTARSFQLAAERCIEKREDQDISALFIPSIVNSALACELYFKAIIYWDNPNKTAIKEHKLNKLFEMLSQERRQSILCKLEKYGIEKENVLRCLKQYGDIFVEYRYVYEIDSEDRNNFVFLSRLATELYDIVGELTWDSVYKMAGLERMKR